MQNERMFQILDAAVREFIETGEPISSNLLFERYDFGIRPAMIRAELSRLTEQGFLEQPYHSAGRVPSNRGFEFFAEQVLRSRRSQPPHGLAQMLFGGDLESFLSALSAELGIAVAAGTEEGEVVKEGLEPLMENLAWGPREEILQVIKDFESLEKRMAALRAKLADDNFLNVFIGRKSPVTKSDELAVLAGDCSVGGERVILFVIGPKRMDYEKAAAIFKGLKESANS